MVRPRRGISRTATAHYSGVPAPVPTTQEMLAETISTDDITTSDAAIGADACGRLIVLMQAPAVTSSGRWRMAIQRFLPDRSFWGGIEPPTVDHSGGTVCGIVHQKPSVAASPVGPVLTTWPGDQ